MRAISVIHVIWSGHIGGIEKVVFDLVAFQRKRENLHVEILICKDGGSLEKKFREIEVPCSTLNMKYGFNISLAKYAQLKKIFSGFDVVHFHSFNPVLAWAAVWFKKKIVYTEHGNFSLGRKITAVQTVNRFFQKRFLNNSANFLTFNSNFTRKMSESLYGLGRTNREVVYNGISKSSFLPVGISSMGLLLKEKTRNKFVIGTMARFAEVKRIDRLIETFAAFVKNKNALLLLCGDGPMRTAYEKLISDFEIKESVFITGFVEDASIIQPLFDVCVVPSCGEAFGLAALESLAHGTPVLVYADGGGVTEIVSSLANDDVVESNSQLLSRLNYYFNKGASSSEEKIERINYAAKFSIEKMENSMNEIYEKII